MNKNFLTSREKDIFDMLIKNKSTKEISLILNISEKTVRNHVSCAESDIFCNKNCTKIQDGWIAQIFKRKGNISVYIP